MDRRQSLRALALSVVVMLAVNATAAGPVKVLYTFQGGTNGQNPFAAPVLDAAGNLYGTALNTGCSPYCEVI
jgi:hypothetical protein